MKKQINLKTAYSVKTPQDSVDLYARWANSYDADFARKNDYTYPDQIASIFADRYKAGSGPVLDVGAGTGLVGQGLARRSVSPIDAIDISTEMLDVAMGKGCYRDLIVADLTRKLDIKTGTYDGIICAGTFTHGHVGPEAMDELLRVAGSGALFVLGINAEIYESGGFMAKFEEFSEQIDGFEIITANIYGTNTSQDLHSAQSSVAVFWRC